MLIITKLILINSFVILYCYLWTSLVAHRLKHLPGMRETWVWSLGREDPLEKEMATHCSTLAWRIPWREGPGRLQSMGSQSRTWLSGFAFTFTFQYRLLQGIEYSSLCSIVGPWWLLNTFNRNFLLKVGIIEIYFWIPNFRANDNNLQVFRKNSM